MSFAERASASRPRVPEIGDDALRELIVGDYRVMYEVVGDVVEVLVVRDARRRFPYDRFLND